MATYLTKPEKLLAQSAQKIFSKVGKVATYGHLENRFWPKRKDQFGVLVLSF